MAKILLIEDELELLELYSEELMEEGHIVYCAVNGQEGLAQARELVPDLIVSDINMPGLTGIELLAALHGEADDVAVIPVILITAQMDRETEIRAHSMGAVNILHKPVDFSVMRAAVSSQLLSTEKIRSHYKRKVDSFFSGITDSPRLGERDDFLKDLVQRHQHLMRDSQLVVTVAQSLEQASFDFRTPEEGRHVALLLSYCFPDPQAAGLGLVELIYNAIEHGNLGVDSEEKSRLLQKGIWHETVEERLRLPAQATKFVTVEFSRRDQVASVTIRDQGAGFDWSDYLSFDREQAGSLHGRGVAIAANISFDSIRYNESGNEVTAETGLNRK